MSVRPRPKDPLFGLLRLAVGVVAAFLLLSLGGAQVIAAPVTLPALWWATRTARSTVARVLLTMVASLTMLVVGAVAASALAGENTVALILGAVTGVVAAIVLFLRTAWPELTSAAHEPEPQ